VIAEPCVIDGMSDAEYHADPVEGGSLSSTGARAILKSPARFAYDRTHRVEKRTFDVGHAAHAKILGVGMGVVEIPFEHLTPSGNVSTKVITTLWLSARRAEGLVPVTPNDLADVDAMAEAVLANHAARLILEDGGKSEQSVFAPDDETGVWLRARIDRLSPAGPVDLKTTTDADPEVFARTAAGYGYDVQQEFYLHTLRLAGAGDLPFLFIVVESKAPYLTSVVELDAEFAAIGRQRMRRAIDTYKRCTDEDDWPGYGPGTHLVGPPRWLAYEEGMVL